MMGLMIIQKYLPNLHLPKKHKELDKLIMKNKRDINNIKLFVLDMDGTFYLGDNIIEGALDFITKIKGTGKSFIFFTNNSSKASSDYIYKLAGMNCYIDRDQILTSGDVTIEYINTYYHGARVYLLGTRELEISFEEANINLVEDKPDLVVVGFDKSLTYHKLERACTFIRQGAEFIATHLDINCPLEDGFIPDCGAICAAISLSTGVEPKYIGKPFKETIDMIVKRTGFKNKEIAFVGDRIYTDVAAGVNNGGRGILVLTGEAKLEDVDKSKVKPDLIFESLKEMSLYLE